MTRQVLDARRLLCPLPVIRTQQAVEQLKPGDTLEVCATDPGALLDIPTWCRLNGHDVISATTDGPDVRITLLVKEA